MHDIIDIVHQCYFFSELWMSKIYNHIIIYNHIK